MTTALFISDLHCSKRKYDFLFSQILKHKPALVFLGGDLGGKICPDSLGSKNFYRDFLQKRLQSLQAEMKESYPRIFVIMGNDDPILQESELIALAKMKLIEYVHEKIIPFGDYEIAGYSYVPPTPFLNKDWEKYDVSGFVDVGCVSPECGYRCIEVDHHYLRYHTIKRDLEKLFAKDVSRTIFLFHAPPYQTNLDRAALDGQSVDHVPLDVHVGSIAIKEFILTRLPYITLHGHIHESTRLTGKWQQKIGTTYCFQGALEKDDIGLIKFDLENPETAEMITENGITYQEA